MNKMIMGALAIAAIVAVVLLPARAGTGYDASPLKSPLPVNFVRWLQHCEDHETGWRYDCCVQGAYCAWGYDDRCSQEERRVVCSPSLHAAAMHTLYLPAIMCEGEDR